MSETILSKLLKRCEDHPEKLAIVSGKRAVRYGELRDRICSAAARFKDMGVGHGDRIILAASSSPSFTYGYFGTHAIGAVAISIDPLTPASRLRFIIEQVDPKGVFTVKEYNEGGFSVSNINELDSLEYGSIDVGVPDPRDVSDVLFTTGTTGKPKGVVLTHGNILSAARNINTFIGNKDDDVEIVPLPLSHSFGLGRLRCAMLAGGTIVLVDGFTFPGRIFRAMEQFRATGFAFVPAGLAVLLRLTGDEIGKYAEQLRYIEIGSAPMPQEHKEWLMRLLPKTRICMHYGLTEASRSTFIEFHESREKLNSIGKPSPSVEVRVSDENDRELPPNQTGRIMVKGKMVMKGYWKDDELTESALREGWLCTGDVGYRDDDGFLYLAGREGDMINVGGLKVSPVEVEEVLSCHVKVENCACIGIPDPGGITGEAVKAYLVSKNPSSQKPTGDELIEFLKGKLEPYKIPVAFEWVESIPQTSSGKIQRDVLRRQSSN